MRGDLVEVKDDSTPPVTQRSYVYTPSGLLSSVVYAGAQNPASMLWDSDSNRVGFIDSSNQQTWQYVYDRTAGIPAVIEEVSSSGVVYYVREPGGELVASLRGGSVYYYHFDGLGSTRAITDSAGNVTDTYSYDAWGNVTSHIGPTSQPYQFVGQLGYYTHSQEPGLGLMQLGVRFYDSEVGRFTQRDPIGYQGGLNLYEYGWSRPTIFTDPRGKLAGRYQSICGGVCSGTGFWRGIGCKACKCLIDKVCNWGKAGCCMADKVACAEQCDQKYSDGGDRIACYAVCELKYEKCLIDGKAFE